MGTVGINFGAANSGQGFDVASTVTAILSSQKAIESPWQTQLAALKAQDTVFTTMGTDLSTLTTAMQSLTDFSGVLSAKRGSSSDTNVLELTSAATNSIAGSHTIVVSKLAQTSSNYSDTLTNASDTLSGALTIQVGSGASHAITIDSTNNTLATLASAINAAGIGVNASVITDVSGSRLSLVSGTSGSAGQLTITTGLTDATTSTAIGFNVGQSGQDANLTVDGVSLASGSNTVTTAIPGVTFQLLSVSASPIQVQITNDTSSISSAMSNMVSAYNKVINDINGQERKDSSGNAEPLFGSTTLSQLQNQLSSALITGASSGSISSITQLGIGFNQDGTLTLNGDALNTILNSNFSEVAGFLQNSSSFGQSFVSTLNNLGTQAPNGSIYLAQQQNSAQEASLNLSISNEEALLASEKTALTTELNAANQVLQSIPAQLNQVNEMYSAVTGYNSRNGG
jgi:flagellar hook-associated protein 2